MKIRNTCRPLLKKIAGKSLLYRIKFLFLKKIAFSKSEIIKLARMFVLHGDQTTVDICLEQVAELSIEGSFLEITVNITKFTRQSISVYEDYKLLLGKMSFYNNRVKKEDGPFRVDLNEDMNYILPVFKSHNHLLSNDYFADNCPNPIAMTSLQFCELVLFKKEPCNNIITMGNGAKFHRQEYVTVYEREDVTNAVCKDVFVSKMNLVGGFPTSGSSHLSFMSGMKCHVLVNVNLLMTVLIYFYIDECQHFDVFV